MRTLLPLIALALLASLTSTACGDAGSAPAARTAPRPARERPLVVTTFYPLEFVAERIGGERVEVRCDVPSDADPLFWSPTPEMIALYQTADLILFNGAGLESWADKVSLPPSIVVDTSRGFRSQFLEFEDAITHTHGPGEEHTHAGIDAHVWMDPVLLARQAAKAHEALAKLLPDHADELATNHAQLASELDALHKEFAKFGSLPAGESLVASHPAYDYLAKRRGWPIVNLDLNPEAELDDATLARVRERLKDTTAEWILWESEPIGPLADRIESELGLKSVLFSPCELLAPADRKAGLTYLQVQWSNLERLRPAFQAR